MNSSIGVLYALGALGGWAFGDFTLQRASRHVGIWRTRFFIAASMSIVLFPFVIFDLGMFFRKSEDVLLLSLVAAIVLFGSHFNFRALKHGKLAFVESLTGFELPLTILGSIVLLGEHPSLDQWGLIALIFLGILLASRKTLSGLGFPARFEQATAYALLGAGGLAIINITIGVASRQTSPLLVNWYVSSCIALICAIRLLARERPLRFFEAMRGHYGIVLVTTAFNNLAIFCFAQSATHLPISIATTISEGYIALAAILGVTVNRERFRTHQYVGIIFSIGGVLLLSAVAGK